MRSAAKRSGPRSRQAMGAVATTKASAPSAASTNGTRTQRRCTRPSGNQATSSVTMAAKPGNHTHDSSDATAAPAGSDPGLVSTAYRPYSPTRPDTASDTPMTRHSLPTGWPGSRRSTTAPRTENVTAAIAPARTWSCRMRLAGSGPVAAKAMATIEARPAKAVTAGTALRLRT
jgi:hypothetical protein